MSETSISYTPITSTSETKSANSFSFCATKDICDFSVTGSINGLDDVRIPIKDRSMPISRELAIKILKYLDQHEDFYFPFFVMNKEYTEEDDDFVELEPNEWEMIAEDDKYQTFQLWENLQNLYEETIVLMAKGFIEKITGESLQAQIAELARNYRKDWKEELWESTKIEEYGLNEFLGGKAEAYEDCLRIIKECSI